MDWLEQWFGIWPDDGDGSFELLIVLMVLAAGAVFVIWRRQAGRAAILRFLTLTAVAARTMSRGCKV